MSTVSTQKMMAQIACKAIDDKKGQDIILLDIHEKTSIADYFVNCSGSSKIQTKAIADNIEEKLDKEYGVQVLHREGFQSGEWILLDYGTVVVQIFQPETRQYYNLEKLWSDAEQIDVSAILGEE